MVESMGRRSRSVLPVGAPEVKRIDSPRGYYRNPIECLLSWDVSAPAAGAALRAGPAGARVAVVARVAAARRSLVAGVGAGSLDQGGSFQGVALLLVLSELAGQGGVLVADLRGVDVVQLLSELMMLGVDRGQRLLMRAQAAGQLLALVRVAVGSPPRRGRQAGQLLTERGGGLQERLAACGELVEAAKLLDGQRGQRTLEVLAAAVMGSQRRLRRSGLSRHRIAFNRLCSL
jgi:hypothetical protein